MANRRRKPETADPEPPRPCPRLVIRDEQPYRGPVLDRMLPALQNLVVCYPQLVGAVVRALIEEGKQYAMTPEGAQLHHELSGAAWVEKGRILWEACGLDALADGAASSPPLSEAIRSLRSELPHADLEALLLKLILGSRHHEIPSQPDS